MLGWKAGWMEERLDFASARNPCGPLAMFTIFSQYSCYQRRRKKHSLEKGEGCAKYRSFMCCRILALYLTDRSNTGRVRAGLNITSTATAICQYIATLFSRTPFHSALQALLLPRSIFQPKSLSLYPRTSHSPHSHMNSSLALFRSYKLARPCRQNHDKAASPPI